jgi:hypothetical protein
MLYDIKLSILIEAETEEESFEKVKELLKLKGLLHAPEQGWMYGCEVKEKSFELLESMPFK